MPDHLWADRIQAFLDDAGEPIVWTTPVEPDPANRRLLEHLGVRIEVKPVTASAGVVLYCPHEGCTWSFDRVGTRGEGFLATHLRITHGGADPRQNGKTQAGKMDTLHGHQAPRHPASPEPEPSRAGIKSDAGWSRKKVSREDAIAALQQATRELGHVPDSMEWKRDGRRPAAGTLFRIFGTWGAALKAAGITETTKASPKREERKARALPDAKKAAGAGAAPNPAPRKTEPEPLAQEPPHGASSSTGNQPASPGPALPTAEPGSGTDLDIQYDHDTWLATFALTGNFAGNAQRIRDEAERLKLQAAALAVIAHGFDMLGEAG